MATLTTPSDAHSERMLAVVRELLRELDSPRAAEHASLDSSFERDLGLGSLERVELLVRVERAFDGRLPDDVAQQGATPAEWLRALDATAAGGPRRDGTGRYPIIQPAEAAAPPASPASFLDVLRERTDAQPDRVQVHLMDGDEGQDISYGQLLERSREVAVGLVASGLKRNEAVAIMLPTGDDFFYGFFGIALAGGIAVPIYPPAQASKIEEYVKRQVGILRNADVRFLISFGRVQAVSQVMRLALPSVQEVTTISELRRRGRARPAADVDPAEIFLLQYTSGSTGNPKGVALGHANVLANIQGIGWGVQVKPDDTVVSWLPLYHDMGLIGSWLFSVYYGFPITILSPLDFLSRPERWLWALSDTGRDVLCPAPNFSYELCARKIPDEALSDVDLSRWRVVINAGEAVLPETLARFEKRFRAYGFNAKGFIPCYGLAESSVALTFPPLWRRPLIDTIDRARFEREGRAEPSDLEPGENGGESKLLRFVANGRPIPGHEVRIVDEENLDVAERVRGRVLFRGPSKTSGYYRNPEATSAVTTDGGWMDTGDLGYWADGELYITGRLKETIIKGGHNITPQEIELAAADVAGVRRGCVAAFGVTDRDSGTEKLIVVAETRSGARGEFGRIREEIVGAVDERVGTPPDHVELVAPQTIPKTSSGKIRRNETRLLYEQGRLGKSNRPPWLQMAHLWAGHAGASLGLLARQAGARARRAARGFVVLKVGSVVGLLARLAPTRLASQSVIRRGARLMLSLAGQGGRVAPIRSNGREPRLYVANRDGRFDPLTLIAALGERVSLAEDTGLEDLPLGAAFLLEPLVITPVDAAQAPPGGTLDQRVGQALADGESVLVFAENPAGREIERNRYRLEPLMAAAAAGAEVVPVRLSAGGARFDADLHGIPEVAVTLGDSIAPDGTGLAALSKLRERIRKTIAGLPDKSKPSGDPENVATQP